tara:strand:- start:23 stop:304 length:282 start_codon:yes stop_codon:yes gene_type:complete
MKKLGFSPKEIGEKLDRSEWSIRDRAADLGTPWRKELGTSILMNSTANGFDHERDAEAKQREGDRRLVRAVAEAIARGENLPAGSPIPLRLIG